jgi:hypothetical protein
MFLLPFEHIQYSTTLKEEEVRKRLQDFIDTQKEASFWSLGNRSGKPYEGEIWGSQFTMSRIIFYRNSFLPVIKGRIEHSLNGLTIDVKMQLHPVVFAFLIYWVYFWGRLLPGIPLACLVDGATDLVALMPFGMLLFVYTMTIAAFKFEVNKSREDLRTLFEGHIME